MSKHKPQDKKNNLFQFFQSWLALSPLYFELSRRFKCLPFSTSCMRFSFFVSFSFGCDITEQKIHREHVQKKTREESIRQTVRSDPARLHWTQRTNRKSKCRSYREADEPTPRGAPSGKPPLRLGKKKWKTKKDGKAAFLFPLVAVLCNSLSISFYFLDECSMTHS